MSFSWGELLVYTGLVLLFSSAMHGSYLLFCRVNQKQYARRTDTYVYYGVVVIASILANYLTQ
jgi:hypothetical protein